MTAAPAAKLQQMLQDPVAALAARDQLEQIYAAGLEEAIREFLQLLSRETIRRVRTNGGLPWENVLVGPLESPITAAGELDLFALGTLRGWWQRTVAARVVSAVWGWFTDIFPVGRPGWTSIQNMPNLLTWVTDRLVRGLEPGIDEHSFDLVRGLLAQAAWSDWGVDRLAERIAHDLSWTTDRAFYQAEYDRITDQILARLDPLGPPGSQAREWARLNDPEIAALQADTSQLRLILDAEQSYWQTRAERIARTESGIAYNYATLAALAEEGWTYKMWISTLDNRTRDEHRELLEQTRLLDQPFEVVDEVTGQAYNLMMPGDPAAPPDMTINCRCIMIGTDEPDSHPVTG